MASTAMSRGARTSANLLVLLLGAAVFLNYVDRGAIGIAAPLMKAELGLSEEAYGIAFSAFFWIYAPVQLFAGWLCDRFSVYRLMAVGILLWAGSTLLMGFAGGFASLLVLRIMLGVGESISFPGSSKIIARHVAARTPRGRQRHGRRRARAWARGRDARRRADPRRSGAGARCSSSSGSSRCCGCCRGGEAVRAPAGDRSSRRRRQGPGGRAAW